MADSPLKRLADMRHQGRWLLSAIDGVLESTGKGRTDPGWFHPSSLSNPCDAFLAFQFLGAPSVQKITARQQRIYDLGSARDAALKKAVRKAGVSLIKHEEDRKIVILPYRIRGELDEWVENPISQERMVVDFKTINTNEFEALEFAKPDHVIQVHPYMFGKETYRGSVLYENKNNQEFKLFTFQFDMKFWQDGVVNRIDRILSELQQGFVRRTPPPNDSQCPFYHMCSYASIPELKEKSGINF